jgi:hypothetical protein
MEVPKPHVEHRVQSVPGASERLVPLFDTTSITAVQSLFERTAERDPWGVRLAGSLANMLIYSDEVRFPLPLGKQSEARYPYVIEPTLLKDITFGRDDFVIPVPYETATLRDLSPDSIYSAFVHYSNWALRHSPAIIRFCRLHHQSWVRQLQHIPRVPRGTVHDLSSLVRDRTFTRLIAKTSISEDDHLYCFDIVLRYAIYGQMAGSASFYLNHPLRDAFRIPTHLETPGRPPPLPISFAPTIRDLVSRLTRDEYITTIRILRDKVRQYGLIGAPPGDIQLEVLRKMLVEARLPAKLNSEAAVVPVIGTILTSIVGLLSSAPVAAAIGIAVGISTAAWTITHPTMPISVSQVKWLRWALRWDEERQVQRKIKQEHDGD